MTAPLEERIRSLRAAGKLVEAATISEEAGALIRAAELFEEACEFKRAAAAAKAGSDAPRAARLAVLAGCDAQWLQITQWLLSDAVSDEHVRRIAADLAGRGNLREAGELYRGAAAEEDAGEAFERAGLPLEAAERR